MYKFIIDKKKLGIILVISGLMITLFAIGGRFERRIKHTVLIQNNIKSLKEYNITSKNLIYKLPSKWDASIRNFSGSEIIYHNDFISEDAKIHGFVQFMNMNEDLKTFLDKSKEISQEQNAYTKYEIEPIKIKDRNGYLLAYSMITPKDLNYIGYEYFLKVDNGFIRFSFFVKDDNFKDNMPAIFESIVNTLKSI